MMCLNRKVIGGLAVAALAVLVFAPSAFSRVLPVLVAAACPLGMLLMIGRGATGACHRKEGEAGQPAAGTAADAAAEIAGLRAEVEQLRAGRTAGPSSSATPVSSGEQE